MPLLGGDANRVLDVLNGILNHAVQSEVITRNPAKGILLNPERKMTRFLSMDERIRLLDVLDEAPPRHVVKADLIRMLLFTGCRRGEIINLKWQDVDEITLAISDSKTGPRQIWLGEAARIILARQRPRCTHIDDDAFVFPHARTPFQPVRHIDQYWRKIRIKADIADVRLHGLRHSFASEVVRQGSSLPVISKLLGHSSLAMTMRYTHLSDARITAAAERIGQAINNMMEGKEFEG